MTDLLLNAAIAALMLGVLLYFGRKDGRWTTSVLRSAFRYFTVLSNVLCAAAALLMCIFPQVRWTWTLKYVGTAAVTVTMLTVLLFLGPALGYRPLLSGSDLIMHLITPILALVSFCAFERRSMGFGRALLGLLPVTLYGVLYAYKVLLAPPGKAWEDFYGFNKGGKFYISILAMLTGNLLICLVLMALQNL